MEHKLITGGEQHLPFARSRIKALRAAGLKYASQQFEIDGCSIKVRIEPGQEYITLSGGSAIEMDSGVVSAPFSAGLGQEFTPGVLQETSYVADYNAPFVPKNDGFRYNPNAASAGQLAGKITYGGNFKGAVPLDNHQAKSFSPKRDDAGAQVADDELLYSKKIAGHECPASIFTGKCRLYVQAMFGRPLYAGKARANPTPGGAGTSLNIQAYPHEGEPGGELNINTATGVWLDPETGGHWLFNVADTVVYAYPLIGGQQAEPLRKFLKGADSKLSTEDKEHLEAYVLSTCRPDLTAVQHVTKPSIWTSYSMGYSWHWAWSTPRADIVVNGSYWGGGFYDNFGMESTHYSFLLTPVHATDADGIITGTTFSLAHQTVEGPTRWAVRRFVCTIVEPLWGIGMIKSTAAGARPIACDGPFYAFYKRDELNVCRVHVDEIEGEDEQQHSSDWFQPWFENRYWMQGAGVASAKNLVAQPLWWDISVSIGATVYSGFHLNDVKSGPSWEVAVADGPPAEGTTSYGDGYSSYQLQIGPDQDVPGSGGLWEYSEIYTGPAYHPPDGVGGAIAETTGQLHNCAVTTEYNFTTISHNCMMVIMVPGYDAEAVFVNTRKWTNTESNGRCVLDFTRYNYLETQTIHFNTGGSVSGVRQTWAPHDGLFGNAVTHPSTSVDSDIEIKNELICSAGVIPSNFAPTWQFYDFASDDIEGLYRLTTSVKGAAISEGVIDPYGLNQEAPLFPIFVGWA